MSKGLTILLLLTIVCQWGYGQGMVQVSGVVRDEKGVGLSKANIQLLISKDTLRTISGEDGTFTFIVKTSGRVEIAISMEGYKPFQKVYDLEAGKETINLSPIVLAVAYQELESVTVRKIKPFTIKGDTLEYNAGAYTLRAGAELERLMRRLPGVYRDIDGSLMVEGRKISKVMVNGQDFAGDVDKALENLPVDIIDKVQVIDDYGDKARLTGVKSGEPTEVLNVVLKEDKRHGGIGRIEAGVGDKGRYNGTLFSELFSGDQQVTVNGKLANVSPAGDLHERELTVAYGNKWNPIWSGSAEVLVWGDTYGSNNGLVQDNFFIGSQQHLQQDNQLSGCNKNEMITYMQTYTPDANTLFRGSAFVGIYHNVESLSNTYTTQEQDSGFTKTNSGTSLSTNQSNSLAAGSNFLFEKKYSHSGQKISIEASYRYNNRHQEEDDKTQALVQADSLNNNSLQYYFVHTDNMSRELNLDINYYFPLGKGGMLEVGYDWINSTTENNYITKIPDSTNNILQTIDSLSNDYIFTTVNNLIHAGYLAHTKKFSLNLGFGVQPWSQQGWTEGKTPAQENHYFSLLPKAQLSYSLNEKKIFRLTYSGSSTAPTLQQVQPVLNLTNPQYPVQGNPTLKPSYTQSVNLHYEHRSLKPTQYWGFSLGLDYKSTSNMIISDLIHPKDSSAVIQRTEYVNANGFHSLGVNWRLDIPAVLHKRLRINTSGQIGQTQNAIMTEHILYTGHNLIWGQGVQFSLDIPDLIEADLGGHYIRTLSMYSTGGSSTFAYSSFEWSFHNRNELFRKWILDYGITQSLNQTPGSRLQPNSALLNVSIQRDLFSKNQANISLSLSDLLNRSTGVTQTVDPTGVTTSKINLIGRYFLLKFIFKIDKFR